MKNLKPILLLEDDYVDTMAVKRAFDQLMILNPVISFKDGNKAFEQMKNENEQLPCLILLDLNLLDMNGLEFLKAVKSEQRLKNIPVVAMTDSNNEQDKINSFESGIAGYIVKPNNYEKFLEAIKTIDQYWTLSKLPNR